MRLCTYWRRKASWPMTVKPRSLFVSVKSNKLKLCSDRFTKTGFVQTGKRINTVCIVSFLNEMTMITKIYSIFWSILWKKLLWSQCCFNKILKQATLRLTHKSSTESYVLLGFLSPLLRTSSCIIFCILPPHSYNLIFHGSWILLGPVLQVRREVN